MTYSEKAVRQRRRPAAKLLKSTRRLADLWKVWGLEGELKQLERSFGHQEGRVLMAGALRKELSELKGQLSAKAHCAPEPKRAKPYSSGGCLEDACARRPWG